ncbi:MAG: ATP-binding protein, partial [Chloroflexota bacterium]|nr:ATP-binding protein [Chloroflexota bacterium]
MSTTDRFPSLAALRAAHSTLLQAHRTQGETDPGLLTAIDTFVYQAQASGALLDNEEERMAAQGLLDYWTTILYRAGQPDHDLLLAEFDPASAPHLADELCPFVGLNAFREQNGAIFFGRQRLIEQIIAKLQQERLVAVVGASGSGKSSVVLAGLIPALKGGAIEATPATLGSQTWRYAPRMVPGSNPLANLARLLQTAGETDDAVEKGPDWLTEQTNHLTQSADYLVKLVDATGGAPVVLVVDQFEEVFTLCTDPILRAAFVHALLALVQTPV